jgi:hypothetical protein
MTAFVDNYEVILREHAIKNYVRSSTTIELADDILKMIHNFNLKKKNSKVIEIHRKFPSDLLVDIMKPYLYLYLHSIYSLVEKVKLYMIKLLNKKLVDFQKYNPEFGRKIITFKLKMVNNVLTRLKVKKFNSKHIKFAVEDNFMNNHLEYKYISIDSDTEDIVQNQNQTQRQTQRQTQSQIQSQNMQGSRIVRTQTPNINTLLNEQQIVRSNIMGYEYTDYYSYDSILNDGNGTDSYESEDLSIN